MQITGQSDSRKLFDYLTESGLEPDTLYSKESLSAAIGKPIDENREPLYRAIRMLEKHHNRTMVCVFRQGYRVARANEVPDIATQRLRRASRQVTAGVHTVTHTDLAGLSQTERQRHDLCRAAMLAMQKELRQVKRRLTGVEERVEVLEQRPTLSDEEVVLLRSLLKKAA